MARNSHNSSCSNAKNPGCKCAGCGGALHSWQGWTDLAKGTDESRAARRQMLVSGIAINQRGELGLNAPNRSTYVDLARLDAAEYLSEATPSSLWEPPPTIASDPKAAASSPGRLELLGHKIMAETWAEIQQDIDRAIPDKNTAHDVKQSLASHTWCTLLVGLIRWIDHIDQAVQFLSDQGKQFVKSLVTERVSGPLGTFAEIVINIVIDRVWSALGRLVQAHLPLFGEDTLRLLRILALFTCPRVDHHPAVYQHAALPLMEDAQSVISDDVKTQLITLFTPWWRSHEVGLAG